MLLAACSGDDNSTTGLTTGTGATDPTSTTTGTGSETDATTTGGTDSDSDSGMTEATTESMTTTTTTTGESESATDPTGSTTAVDPVCGDGVVDDGEACDDGVNDGAYGGCAPDCSALAASCGDGNVDADDGEVCDDGVNDGSYEGCAVDCLALGPYCGDGVADGPEECDDGNDIDDDLCTSQCVSLFMSATFTSCGKVGHLGPSQAECDATYTGEDPLAGKVTVAGGIQEWEVPASATYRIEVFGAEGGKHNFGVGGRGARAVGDFDLLAGDTLRVLVGQKGGDGTSYNVGAGGGTFVVDGDNAALIVAGGGGAAGNCGGGWNLSQQDGKIADGNGAGGQSSGNGGWCGCGGAGSAGVGFNSDGVNSGAKSFVNGGAGDDTERPGQCVDSGIGGFGGGGNGGNGGGGGGGYQGGDGGGINGGITHAYGKGGLSFNTGANPDGEDGVHTGAGEVVITKL